MAWLPYPNRGCLAAKFRKSWRYTTMVSLCFWILRCTAVVCVLYTITVNAASKCEILKASLRYTQEDAPTDLSGVLPVVVERINTVLEGVVDVEVEWTGGDLQGQVGDHFVQCKVTRLASVSTSSTGLDIFVDDEGRNVFTQCFHVPFTITDTNECMLPVGHSMRHQCHEPSICVNTIGSYECLCRRIDAVDEIPDVANMDFWTEIASQSRGPWERSILSSTKSSCPGQASTHGCCPARAHMTRGDSQCRASFRCPRDPCIHNNTCAASATCTRKASPTEIPDFECQCPAGLMGNGRKCRSGDPKPDPKVKFDGKTPTEFTLKNNYFCDCTKPVVDACDGFPPCAGKHQICTMTSGKEPICACKPGFVFHDKFGCVDESPPLLRLKSDPDGDRILRLKQGDVYKEFAVEIQDENAEEYLRSLKIAYSKPLPSGCLTEIGEFHVNYTVATPWTSPPYVRITRRVIIEDIDECSLGPKIFEAKCPSLVHRCDISKGAICVNTIGSYTCKCPKFTSGDGFQENLSFGPHGTPEGFHGGTSCQDTNPPVISLRGPNPKVFRVCECAGISGIMGKRPSIHEEIRTSQQTHYEGDIKDLISATAGAELCATPIDRSPNPSDCIVAYDETYKGRVDLSKSVVVGEPIKKSALRWSVPYNVKDSAGNAAITIWRDVVVEEVDIAKIEARIREEFLNAQRIKDKALEEERKIKESIASSNRDRRVSASCPECLKCDMSGKINEASCQEICNARIKSCAIDEETIVVQMLIWLERWFPPSMVPIVLVCNAIVITLLMLRWILTLVFNPQAYHRRYYDDVERERALMKAVAYHHNNPTVNGVGTSYVTSPPPAVNMNGHFPSQQTVNGTDVPVSAIRRDEFADIYQSPIITPSKRGDGVRRRTPYSGNSRDSM